MRDADEQVVGGMTPRSLPEALAELFADRCRALAVAVAVLVLVSMRMFT